jgi:predicted Zn finger-like uncharacterized protein
LTVFRVTGAILKMGRGQVRCGKCRQQFDALECMLEDEDVDAPPESGEQSVEQSESQSDQNTDKEDLPDIESTYNEEVTMEGSRIEISGTYRMPDEHDAKQEKIVREHVVIDRGLPIAAADSAVLEVDDVIGEILGAEPGEAELDLNLDDGEPVADAADQLLDRLADPVSEEQAGTGEAPALPKRWRRALHIGKGKDHEEIHAELHALTQNGSTRVLRSSVWMTLCGVLVVMLIVQVIHHNRDALVRSSKFGNTVSRLYRVFGMSPTPHWDLSAYQWDIYKVGLDPKIPDALRVTGSVANNAPFAQPYPLGKLSLKDRWESPVGVRAFEPYEYLPSPEAADRLMAPKQRVNIEIVIADPGPDAVGYLIHACLEQDRRLSCADDLQVFK